MKIEIELHKGFTLKDWKDAKNTIDCFLFEQFERNETSDTISVISEMNGLRQFIGRTYINDSDGKFSININRQQSEK